MVLDRQWQNGLTCAMCYLFITREELRQIRQSKRARQLRESRRCSMTSHHSALPSMNSAFATMKSHRWLPCAKRWLPLVGLPARQILFTQNRLQLVVVASYSIVFGVYFPIATLEFFHALQRTRPPI